MKRLAIALFAVVMGTSLMVQDAEAARLGGGKSSGVSRDSTVMKKDAIPAKPATPANQASPATAGSPAAAAAAAPAASGMSRWMGPLAGLAAGIGLAALFSHLGMGEGMASMLMILALVMVAVFAVRWFMSRRQSASVGPAGLQPAMQYSGAPASGPSGPANITPLQPAPAALTPAAFTPASSLAGSASAQPDPAASLPPGFDVEAFVRQAKLNFVRLQAANDRGDMSDIRQFCSPEMAAEIQLQLQERNGAQQQTDVLDLNAELLDVTVENGRALASVRFSGQLREQAHAPAEAFSEVWHLSKPVEGEQGWVIAGIQQS